MDAIHVKNDVEGANSFKKKKEHKKRKSGEISGFSGEEVVDEGVRKKMKTNVSSDVCEDVSEVVIGAGVDRSFRTKKGEEDVISKVDGSAQEGDKRKVRKDGKGELGDREGRKKKEKRKDAECDDTISTPVDKSSRKEKEKKGIMSKIDGSAPEGEKKEEKVKKGVTGDGEGMKKKKKEKRKDVKYDETISEAVSVVNQTDHEVNEEAVELVDGKKQKIKKKRKDAEYDVTVRNAAFVVNQTDHEVNEAVELVEGEKKKKKRKHKDAQFDDTINNASSALGETEHEVNQVVELVLGKKWKKKEKCKNMGSVENTKNSLRLTDERDANGGKLKQVEGNETAETFESSRRIKKSKKVRFSEDVEVFLHTDISDKGKEMLKNGIKEKETVEDSSENKEKVDDGLIRGKRFSKKEDEAIQNAVLKYIEDHSLGEEGLYKVLHCKSYREVKNCWKEIREALPHRPQMAIYTRAHILFERSDASTWTPEEIELLKQFYEKYGPDWKTLAVELGRHRFHVKDAWRRYKFPNLKTGSWSQEEYKELFNLVNMDLSTKAYTEKKLKHGMLRDNICWGAISDELTTRTNVGCCKKWYNQLTSPMVGEGKWANVDDYRLLIALNDLDAACEEDVNWDDLLEHRSGDCCRKRWNEMVRHIGVNVFKQLNEQVEILSQRYCPDLLDAREEYDNRPAVD